MKLLSKTLVTAIASGVAFSSFAHAAPENNSKLEEAEHLVHEGYDAVKEELSSELAHFASDLAVAVEHTGGSSLPQLDPSSFVSQIFWMFVFFGILYLILSNVALPRISRVLERRHNKITGDLEEASELRNEAENIKLAYEKSLVEANEKVRHLMTKTHNALSQRSYAVQQDANAKFLDMLGEAEKNISEQKNKALEGIQEASTAIAIELANKLADIAVNDNDAQAAVKHQFKEA